MEREARQKEGRAGRAGDLEMNDVRPETLRVIVPCFRERFNLTECKNHKKGNTRETKFRLT